VKIAKALAIIAEARGIEVSQERIEIYIKALSDLQPKSVLTALNELLLEGEFFPHICHIRNKIVGEPKQLEDAEAEAAWEIVQCYCDMWHPDIGAYHDAPKLTALQARCLNIIGGPDIVQNNFNGGEAMPFLRKDFIIAYKRLKLFDHFLSDKAADNRSLMGKKGFESISEIASRIKGEFENK
jgi:hypothetical protein